MHAGLVQPQVLLHLTVVRRMWIVPCTGSLRMLSAFNHHSMQVWIISDNNIIIRSTLLQKAHTYVASYKSTYSSGSKINNCATCLFDSNIFWRAA